MQSDGKGGKRGKSNLHFIAGQIQLANPGMNTDMQRRRRRRKKLDPTLYMRTEKDTEEIEMEKEISQKKTRERNNSLPAFENVRLAILLSFSLRSLL